jgi:hypothetical protein
VKLFATVGIAAFAALALLSIAFGGSHAGAGTALAGSGDAPTNTVYTQPAVPAASTGATATFTTPASTLATEKAASVSGPVGPA